MDNAYMTRNDGKFFPVKVHYYGDPEDVDSTLYAGEWLYDHTLHEGTKKAFIMLIDYWAKFLNDLEDVDTLIADIEAIIDAMPYYFLSKKFVEAHAEEIIKYFPMVKESDKKLNDVICDELNQEFMRVRYGGMYDTDAGSRDIYFRISSSGFNWYDIIWKFVYDHEAVIDFVTICRDEEATGVAVGQGFYKNNKGEKYFRMPSDQFIMEKGNPVIEGVDASNEVHDPVLRHLLMGGSIQGLNELPMNAERISDRYYFIIANENRKCLFYN